MMSPEEIERSISEGVITDEVQQYIRVMKRCMLREIASESPESTQKGTLQLLSYILFATRDYNKILRGK